MSNTLIQPINSQQKAEVILKVEYFIHLAETLYDECFPIVPVKFDLKGRASGMYVVRKNKRYIRFNPYLFTKYFRDSLSTTIPHEVAHYITDQRYGLARIKPHGIEWQSVMQEFGALPNVTGQYDLSGIPVRRQQRFFYRCGCMSHEVSATRHNKIRSGKRSYVCRQCGDPISEQSSQA